MNLKGTTVLIGHSMGATQSFYAAFFEPGIFDSIVAIDCVGYSPDGRFDLPESIAQLGRTYVKLSNMIKTHFKSEEDYIRYHDEVGIGKKFHPKCKEAYIDASRIDNPDGSIDWKTPFLHQLAIYMSGQYAYRDAKYVARQLDVEIFHIWGTRENAKEAKLWRKSFRFGHHYDIPGEGHLVPFEKPVEVFNAYRQFLIRRRVRGSMAQKELDVRRRFTPEEREQFNRVSFQNMFEGLLNGKRHLNARL
jgi:pimeloyl-ACP methyl ester carboxylesterase